MDADGGDKGEDRLRRVREEGQESSGRHERFEDRTCFSLLRFDPSEVLVFAGVSSVEIEPKQHKVTVVGYVDPKKVIRRVAWKTGKKAEPWPYVPYAVVAHPYAPGAYDKKAPPGYVRNVVDDPAAAPLARASSTEVKYTTAFSDDNPNNCSVM
ncbi:unnamed protein product [Musa textilis]